MLRGLSQKPQKSSSQNQVLKSLHFVREPLSKQLEGPERGQDTCHGECQSVSVLLTVLLTRVTGIAGEGTQSRCRQGLQPQRPEAGTQGLMGRDHVDGTTGGWSTGSCWDSHGAGTCVHTGTCTC